MNVSVVIPTLNEEPWIAASVRSAFDAGAAETIVSDGGSVDGTLDAARAAGAIVIDSERMRARQLNAGAARAGGEALLFLHADTLLPPGACAAATARLEEGAVFGGFRIAFAEESLRLRFAAAMINLRTAITSRPWGDQAQFIRRETFLAHGRFREIPIMEDYDLAARMKHLGRVAISPMSVTTSGRRFLRKGLLGTAWTNWRIIAAWHRGVDAETLAGMYRR